MIGDGAVMNMNEQCRRPDNERKVIRRKAKVNSRKAMAFWGTL